MTNFVFALETDIGKALEKLPKESAGFWKGDLNTLLNALVQVVLVAAVAAAVILLLAGGIKWITSEGDKEKLSSAQKTITAALLGLAIVFSAWIIINLVKGFFGLGIPGVPPEKAPVAASCKKNGWYDCCVCKYGGKGRKACDTIKSRGQGHCLEGPEFTNSEKDCLEQFRINIECWKKYCGAWHAQHPKDPVCAQKLW